MEWGRVTYCLQHSANEKGKAAEKENGFSKKTREGDELMTIQRKKKGEPKRHHSESEFQGHNFVGFKDGTTRKCNGTLGSGWGERGGILAESAPRVKLK